MDQLHWPPAAADRFTKKIASARWPLAQAENNDWFTAVHIDGIIYGDLTRTIPALLETSVGERLNLIVRPSAPEVMFIQLDDLTAGKLLALAPAMFLVLETSSGNFRAWLAIPGTHDKEFARRVRRGAGADLSANGATRISGSLNFKEKYASNYPIVAIRAAQPGHTTTAAETRPPWPHSTARRLRSAAFCSGEINDRTQMAELCQGSRRCVPQSRRRRSRPQPRRLRLVHDSDRLGLRPRRDGQPLDGRKRQGALEAALTLSSPPAMPRRPSSAGATYPAVDPHRRLPPLGLLTMFRKPIMLNLTQASTRRRTAIYCSFSDQVISAGSRYYPRYVTLPLFVCRGKHCVYIYRLT